ncbi:MAG: 4Fe-4S binding protein [Chloroflexi bacterium]|nr:4Fe-4S binding protein [Chloroflexota bacterium]
MSKVIFMDLNRCIYCRSCEVACEREHNGRSFMSVLLLDERHPVPMNCRHCKKSPCVAVCPTGALNKLENGPVIIETMKCVGCSLCAMVCPFGILELDYLSKVMRKCDLCVHRLNENKLPACVSSCPARALTYDEFDAIMQKVKKMAAKAVISGAGLEPGIVVSPPQS